METVDPNQLLGESNAPAVHAVRTVTHAEGSSSSTAAFVRALGYEVLVAVLWYNLGPLIIVALLVFLGGIGSRWKFVLVGSLLLMSPLASQAQFWQTPPQSRPPVQSPSVQAPVPELCRQKGYVFVLASRCGPFLQQVRTLNDQMVQHADAQEWDQALSSVSALIDLIEGPGHVPAPSIFYYKQCLFEQKLDPTSKDALRDCDKSIDAASDAPVEDSFALRANILMRLGRWTEARRDYKAVLGIDPNDQGTQAGLKKADEMIEAQARKEAESRPPLRETPCSSAGNLKALQRLLVRQYAGFSLFLAQSLRNTPDYDIVQDWLDNRALKIDAGSSTIDEKDGDTGNVICSVNFTMDVDAFIDALREANKAEGKPDDPALEKSLSGQWKLYSLNFPDGYSIRATYSVRPAADGRDYVSLLDPKPTNH